MKPDRITNGLIALSAVFVVGCGAPESNVGSTEEGLWNVTTAIGDYQWMWARMVPPNWPLAVNQNWFVTRTNGPAAYATMMNAGGLMGTSAGLAWNGIMAQKLNYSQFNPANGAQLAPALQKLASMDGPCGLPNGEVRVDPGQTTKKFPQLLSNILLGWFAGTPVTYLGNTYDQNCMNLWAQDATIVTVMEHAAMVVLPEGANVPANGRGFYGVFGAIPTVVNQANARLLDLYLVALENLDRVWLKVVAHGAPPEDQYLGQTLAQDEQDRAETFWVYDVGGGFDAVFSCFQGVSPPGDRFYSNNPALSAANNRPTVTPPDGSPIGGNCFFVPGRSGVVGAQDTLCDTQDGQGNFSCHQQSVNGGRSPTDQVNNNAVSVVVMGALPNGAPPAPPPNDPTPPSDPPPGDPTSPPPTSN